MPDSDSKSCDFQLSHAFLLLQNQDSLEACQKSSKIIKKEQGRQLGGDGVNRMEKGEGSGAPPSGPTHRLPGDLHYHSGPLCKAGMLQLRA